MKTVTTMSFECLVMALTSGQSHNSSFIQVSTCMISTERLHHNTTSSMSTNIITAIKRTGKKPFLTTETATSLRFDKIQTTHIISTDRGMPPTSAEEMGAAKTQNYMITTATQYMINKSACRGIPPTTTSKTLSRSHLTMETGQANRRFGTSPTITLVGIYGEPQYDIGIITTHKKQSTSEFNNIPIKTDRRIQAWWDAGS